MNEKYDEIRISPAVPPIATVAHFSHPACQIRRECGLILLKASESIGNENKVFSRKERASSLFLRAASFCARENGGNKVYSKRYCFISFPDALLPFFHEDIGRKSFIFTLFDERKYINLHTNTVMLNFSEHKMFSSHNKDTLMMHK
jgi:hypothetical protein